MCKGVQKACDRYGRTLAIIRIDDFNVGDILVDEGLARYWPDGDELLVQLGGEIIATQHFGESIFLRF